MPQSIKKTPGFIVALLIISGFTLLPAYSQEDCSTKVAEAQRFYDQGMIDEIPNMLAPCMADGFTRTQKIEAYKLIIMSYLFDENQFEAEKTMLEFLKKYPEYEIMPNDPVEFVYLFESYRTASVFSFGISGGLNFTDPRIIEPFTSQDMRGATLKNTMKPGFQVGFGVERYFSKKILVNLEAYLAFNHYQFLEEIANPDFRKYVSFTEKLYTAEIPLTFSYEFTINKTHFTARAGFSAARITGITGQPERKFREDAQAMTEPFQNISKYRKQMIYSGIVGAGVRYKVPRGIVSLDLRYKVGINNIVIPEKRWDNQVLIGKYYHVDDDFSLNTISLSVGYYFSFYSPRKQR